VIALPLTVKFIFCNSMSKKPLPSGEGEGKG
jgi:hypothetical protein